MTINHDKSIFMEYIMNNIVCETVTGAEQFDKQT